MSHRHLFLFDDPFFNVSSDIDSSFKNLESFMSRPIMDMKRPSLKQPNSNDVQVALRNDSLDPIFDDFDKRFMRMNDMFSKCLDSFDTNFNPSDPNSAFYSSSSVYTYQSDSNSSEPRIYQAHKSIKQGPGGVREEQKAERDSRKAQEKMAIGRYIGDRGREIERKRNMKTGYNEENINYYGIDESESGHFNNEWNQLAGKSFKFDPRRENIHHLNGDSHSNKALKGRSQKSDDHRQLALTDGKSRLRKRH